MDDSKSDNTDDLLTSIEPLIKQSEFLVKQEEYKNNKWIYSTPSNGFHTTMPVIVDDILSSRSHVGDEWKDRTEFQSPSLANIASHNSRLNSDRTIASHLYETSVSAQTTPRNMSLTRQGNYSIDVHSMAQHWQHNDGLMDPSNGILELQLHNELEDTRAAWNQSRTELQRLQLNNKQLSTQLHEAKLSIQTLSIQLEQVQQESKHKESTLSNLDNTLGKLVSGWKKREYQKDQDFDSMKQQVDSKNRVIDECQKIAEESQRALSNADKAVQIEKNRIEQFKKSAAVEIQNMKNEKGIVMKSNQELMNRCNGLEGEIKRLHEIINEKVKCYEVLNHQTKDNNACWQRERESLRKDIDRLKEEESTQQIEIQCREDKLCQMKSEMKLLEDEIHRTRRDRDDKATTLTELKCIIKKMQDDHSMALKKQDKELVNRWQQDLNKRVLDIQDQHKRVIQTQNNNFQGKLNEQSKRHKMELERLRHVAEQEIASRVSDSQETVTMLRERLERSEKSVQFWQQEKEVVEKARNQISSKLFDLMNSGYKDSGQITNNNVTDLVKPAFVPPKNQNLQHTLPDSFFEPIKMDSGRTLQSLLDTQPVINCHSLSSATNVLLSSSNASLYY